MLSTKEVNLLIEEINYQEHNFRKMNIPNTKGMIEKNVVIRLVKNFWSSDL